MVILNQGSLPKPQVPFWVGRTVECPRCGFKAILDVGDMNTVASLIERCPAGSREYWLNCPTPCGTRINILPEIPKTRNTAIFS